MNAVALYTFGLLDPTAGAAQLADFSRRGLEIFGASDHAPGFLGRAAGGDGRPMDYRPGEDFGLWGRYAVPLGLPDFAGQDPRIHIATLSRWRDVESARFFVYRGMHAEALKLRSHWFLTGPWPGHVLWRPDADRVPQWTDGVGQLEELARTGSSPERFTFGSTWSRS